MNEVDEVNGDGLDAVGSAAFCCCQPKTMAIHGALASVTMMAYIFFPTYGVYFAVVYLTIIATRKCSKYLLLVLLTNLVVNCKKGN